LSSDRGRFTEEVILTLMAVSLGVIEGMVPKPIPFLRPGLANIATVAGILRIGPAAGIRINLFRSVGAAIFLGTLATPTFVLSLSGGLASAMVMGWTRNLFSVTGLSVAGSLASISAQLGAASMVLPGLPLQALLLPAVAWGTLAGLITGISAGLLLRRGFPWTGPGGVDSVQPLT